jgi:SUMO ligase MMS21 Smc5/6 complex component
MFEHPVKNPACGHVYEEGAIQELVKQSAKSKKEKGLKCPEAGCQQQVAVKDLIVDADTVAAVKRHQRGLRRGDTEAMDEDDIEDFTA